MERATRRTRKPIEKLTLDDFQAFPVWEYASDEEDFESREESWVRPSSSAVVPKGSYTMVAAQFTSANGKPFEGFVTVSTLDDPPDVCQGAILLGGEYLFVSNPDAEGYDESRKRLLATLGLKEKEAFPLTFRLRVPVAGQAKYSGGTLP